MLQSVEIQSHAPDSIRIIQLTDTHISADENELFIGVQTSETLTGVIADVNLRESPDIVIVTGDLVNIPSIDAYGKLAHLLALINAPVFCLPGNHDDPAMMHAHLNNGAISTAKHLLSDSWAVILLDTCQAGRDAGYLSESELSFLEQALAQSRDKYKLICLHHHPVSIDCPWMDEMGLQNSSSLFYILDNYEDVRGMIWGHIHQVFAQSRNAIRLLGSPSTCVQFTPKSSHFQVDEKPPAYRKLKLNNNGIIETNVVTHTGITDMRHV